MTVYVPSLDYSCYTIYDKDTIRAYHTIPEMDSETAYTDFFVHSDYYSKEGTEMIAETVPQCLEPSSLTDDFYYRQDFSNILIIFIIFFVCAFLIPIKIVLRFFRRFR